jgi:hypothetical protein
MLNYWELFRVRDWYEKGQMGKIGSVTLVSFLQEERLMRRREKIICSTFGCSLLDA